MADLSNLNLRPAPLETSDVQTTSQDLKANPPVSFDVSRKIRVCNARFEFVEFELRGLSISRKTVQIRPDLIGLAKDTGVHSRMRNSFQLIEKDSQLSGDLITRRKQEIVNNHLIKIEGYGTVILRERKEAFLAEVNELDKEIEAFKKRLERDLQQEIAANREILVSALLPGVIANPPDRWRRFVGATPSEKRLSAFFEQT